MGGPFNSAWALLKNERITVKPYPLTPEEEKTLQMQNRAYELARGANPQPPDMTDEQYEDAIKLSGEAILAGMMAKKKPDYPWPKKHPFQTTFENDGSINRDPKVSRERKLNAKINSEWRNRDAVPSQIEISPRPNSRNATNFSLVNNEGKLISRISGNGGDEYNKHILNFYGNTEEQYRRQGMYRKLMQALIGAGIPIISDERNSQSNAFHQKFLESLPPNIESSYVDEYGNPRTADSVEDLDYNTPLKYYQNRVPQFLDAQGERSGLNRQDYGAIPFVNQKNQARNMDELAEQDRAKIRQRMAHTPEFGDTRFPQPMAINTTQTQFSTPPYGPLLRLTWSPLLIKRGCY